MNITNLVHNTGFSARIFAGVTMLSLLLSAFPVAFFVANAANTDAVGDITVAVIPSNSAGPETVTVSFDGVGTLDLTDWTLWDTLSSESKKFTFGAVSLTDGQSYTVCHDGSCDGMSSGGATVWNDSGDTAQLRDETNATIVSTTWGTVTTDTEYSNVESVDYAPGPENNVAICHWDGQGFSLISPNVNSLGNAHGSQGSNDGDIIPVVPGVYGGQNLATDYNGMTGAEVLANGCVIDPQVEPVYGCLDPVADNYDETATEQGEVVCEYPEVAPEVCSYEGTGTFSATALTNGGDPVNPARRDIAALEAGVAPYTNFFGKEGNDWNVNPLDFFSLGINGEVVYEFTDKIAIDQPGADIAIWEITGGNPSEQADEKADVYGSEDGVAFVLLGQVTGDGTVDIAGSGLTFVKFVKLVDQSNGVQGNNGDGFDLDAITIIEGSCDDYATVHTTKIVCSDEADLPNWGAGGADITETTAADWMLANEDSSCEIVEGWEFEWAPKQGTSNPGDALVGPAGGVWTTFSGSTMVPLSLVDGKSFWMREVLQADYTPFAGGKNNDVSAEMYCHTDVLNYDNLDRVDNPVADGEYYCVAWNHLPAPAEQCHLPYLVTFTDESDDDTYSTAAGTGLVIEAVENGYTIGLYDDGRSGIYRVAGTILFPIGTDLSTFTFAEGSLLNGLEQTHGTYPDVADLVGNKIEFDLYVNGADDVFTITDESFVSEANCDVLPPEPEIEYGPYCGDGEINQEWEMCEAGTEGCTDYCTLDNQCTDLQLIKITLDESAPESVSFDGSINLGSADNMIPNGTWFNFDEAGDATAQSIAQATQGLAVERTGTEVRLAVEGDNGQNKFDYVFGSIMTLGIDLGVTDRSPIPGWELEDTGSYIDVWDKDGENLDFKMWLTTGDDAAAVAVGVGEEYNCPDCLAGVEARIMDVTYGAAGNGQVNDDILLGDGTRVAYGEWFPLTSDNIGTFIMDANNATNFPDEDESGLYVSRNGDGTMNVVLVGDHNPGGNTNHEWIAGTVEVRDASIASAAALPGDFKFESHNNGSVPSNDGFDVLGTPTANAVDFKMWVDTASDGFKVTVDDESIVFCEEDTIDKEPEPDTYTLSGVKYEVEGEVETTAAGWTIYAYNGVDTPLSTTTDENGYYYFDVPAGEWEVYEEDRTDWKLVDIFQYPMYYLPTVTLDEELDQELAIMTSCFFDLGFEQESPLALRSAQFLTVETDEEWFEIEGYVCDFYNEYTEPVEEDDEEETSGGSSSSGTRTNRLADAGPAPLVLGASTDTCPFLVDFMQMGVLNDPMEVMKLQLFLNIFKDMYGGTANPATGTFGAITDANVKAFQETYRSEILDPWYNLGIVPHNRPTGFVYKTTLWKINDIVCGDVFPSLEGENLQSNVDLNARAVQD